jgi:hypothetical protein
VEIGLHAARRGIDDDELGAQPREQDLRARAPERWAALLQIGRDLELDV